MPPVQPPTKVLVTGASGFIGTWTARAYLERGYDVRGTVRSKNKGEWLANQAWVKAGPGRFEYIVVEDIQMAGAFDDAVKGDVTVVAHTASPVIFDPQGDPYDLINPAVKGTMGILKSIFLHAPGVKRLVLTSSAGSIIEPTEVPRVFTEEDWNEFSVNDIEAKGKASDPIHKYRASKVKAEKAVWKFVEEHQGNLNFEVTTIHPTFVYGVGTRSLPYEITNQNFCPVEQPIIHEVASIDKLNATTKAFLENIRKEVPPPDFSYGNYVDVRDVAKIHVEAVESDKAAGQRILASAGIFIWQDIYDALNAHSDPPVGVPVGTPGAGKHVKAQMLAYSNEKIERILGFKFTSLGDMAYDTLASLKERGFW